MSAALVRKYPMQSLKNIRSALEESEARYRHLVESASDGIYRINMHGYFLYANPIACHVLAGGESLIGRHYLEFVRQDFHDDIVQFYARQIKERVSSTYYEFPAVTPAGGELWIGQRVQLEIGEQGHVTGLHAVARDITDRKRLEDELRQADKMRVVAQLAGGIAHDFNSLLTAIGGFADLLVQALGPNDERVQDAMAIQQAVDAAARLTSQLLMFSRRELFRPRLLSINRVVADLRPMLVQLLGPAVTLVTQLAPDIEEIRADAGQLEQVLLNLAMNARDAMPKGGTCTIRTDNVYVGPGEVREPMLYPGGYVRLQVGDTGVGMDDAIQSKIFEPFFTTKSPGEAQGLGLSITFGVVSQMGGRITVDSTPDRGTTFDIYLPQAREVPPQELAAKQAPTGPHHGVILLADDEQDVRTVLTLVLEGEGYHVISAANGVDALAKARAYEGEIDLLLTDLIMPQMGGVEVAEALAEERPTTRALFMSGYVDRKGKQPVLPASAQLLYKPFDSTVVLAAVQQAIGKRPVTQRGSGHP